MRELSKQKSWRSTFQKCDLNLVKYLFKSVRPFWKGAGASRRVWPFWNGEVLSPNDGRVEGSFLLTTLQSIHFTPQAPSLHFILYTLHFSLYTNPINTLFTFYFTFFTFHQSNRNISVPSWFMWFHSLSKQSSTLNELHGMFRLSIACIPGKGSTNAMDQLNIIKTLPV